MGLRREGESTCVREVLKRTNQRQYQQYHGALNYAFQVHYSYISSIIDVWSEKASSMRVRIVYVCVMLTVPVAVEISKIWRSVVI
jgi:hypothetical protein